MRLDALRRFFWISGGALLFFCADRLTKLWAEEALAGRDLSFSGNFLRLTLTYNAKLAFSLPFPLAAQVLLSGLLLFVLMWYFTRIHPPKGLWESLAAALIFGGALGNFVDRFFFHEVVDFIAVWKFPVFNLADSFLFLGAVFFLIYEVGGRRKKS